MVSVLQSYLNTLKAFGFEGPGAVNIEQLGERPLTAFEKTLADRARPPRQPGLLADAAEADRYAVVDAAGL